MTKDYFGDEILIKNIDWIYINDLIFVHPLSVIAYNCEWGFHLSRFFAIYGHSQFKLKHF
jgi:hypothetical protein